MSEPRRRTVRSASASGRQEENFRESGDFGCYGEDVAAGIPGQVIQAEVPVVSGVLCYGATRADALARVQALALRVLAARLDHRESEPVLLDVSLEVA